MPLPDGPPETWRHDARELRTLAAAALVPGAPLRILEVGSWMGASAIIWAHLIQEWCGGEGRVTCVDTWQQYGNEAAPYERFVDNIARAGIAHLIEIRRGASDAILPMLDAESYHLAYIDGDHSYAGAKSDIEHAMPLVCMGGILAGDDLEVPFHECNRSLAIKWAEMGQEYTHDPATGLGFHPGVTVAVRRCFDTVWHKGLTWGVRKTADGWTASITG